jgi:hypothetical protein
MIALLQLVVEGKPLSAVHAEQSLAGFPYQLHTICTVKRG